MNEPQFLKFLLFLDSEPGGWYGQVTLSVAKVLSRCGQTTVAFVGSDDASTVGVLTATLQFEGPSVPEAAPSAAAGASGTDDAGDTEPFIEFNAWKKALSMKERAVPSRREPVAVPATNVPAVFMQA